MPHRRQIDIQIRARGSSSDASSAGSARAGQVHRPLRAARCPLPCTLPAAPAPANPADSGHGRTFFSVETRAEVEKSWRRKHGVQIYTGCIRVPEGDCLAVVPQQERVLTARSHHCNLSHRGQFRRRQSRIWLAASTTIRSVRTTLVHCSKLPMVSQNPPQKSRRLFLRSEG